MNLCAPPSTHKRKEQKRKASDHLNQPPIGAGGQEIKCPKDVEPTYPIPPNAQPVSFGRTLSDRGAA